MKPMPTSPRLLWIGLIIMALTSPGPAADWPPRAVVIPGVENVFQVTDGPIHPHCHHGRYRGTAAAGWIAQATAGWTTNQAVQWLQEAGTARDYAGLYRANLLFCKPV